jgi:signal transduction histidine kinase
MEREPLLERLSHHRTLGNAPRAELEWLVDHGELQRFDVGELVADRTQRLEHLYVLLEGHLAIYVERGGGKRKVMEWHGGDVTGVLPYSRMTTPPGDSSIEAPTEALAVSKRYFPELMRDCPAVTTLLVHVMLDRARIFTSSDLHDEKMVSLGRLAAGLAHELNNPASAAARSAKLLLSEVSALEHASQELGAAALAPEERAVVERVRELCLTTPETSVPSPIERADREDSIADWLEAHDADVELASSLADTSVTLDALEELGDAVAPDRLDVALHWIGAGCATRALAVDVEKAASRVHHLVSAVKGFTYMDKPTLPENVPLAPGLADTISVLAYKARKKSVAVTVEVEPDLPLVRGFGGELNQVWANLIDNGLDAAPEGGRVIVSAKHEPGWVVVRVIDNGPGIPPEIRSRIFDPFFTTKPVGSGTGLGLDIARKIVMRHNGEIEVSCQPGRTEFRVSLPIAEERTPTPQSSEAASLANR